MTRKNDDEDTGKPTMRQIKNGQALWDEFELRGEPQLEAFDECLDVIAQECDTVAGTLRPHDSLESVMGKPQSRNPVGWLFKQASFEDRSSELSFRLKRRREEHGVNDVLKRTPISVRDYVLAWLFLEE